MKIRIIKAKTCPYVYKAPLGYTRTGYKFNQIVYFSDDSGLILKKAFKDASTRTLREFASTIKHRAERRD